MEIFCHESPYVDSVFHIPADRYERNRTFEIIGSPSIHDHIILNDKCAVITFTVEGKEYVFDGDMVCGKFTHVPKMKIEFKNPCHKLTIIRLSPCGIYRLIDEPVEKMVNHVSPLSIVNHKHRTGNTVQEYIEMLDEFMMEKTGNPNYELTRNIICHVRDNFAEMPRNAAEMIAARFGISASSLRRYFKEYIGITFSNYLVTIKRKRMIQSLFENNYDSMVVRENGYYDQSHFLNDFKRLYGLPLKQYFKEIQTLKDDAPELMNFLYHCTIKTTG